MAEWLLGLSLSTPTEDEAGAPTPQVVSHSLIELIPPPVEGLLAHPGTGATAPLPGASSWIPQNAHVRNSGRLRRPW